MSSLIIGLVMNHVYSDLQNVSVNSGSMSGAIENLHLDAILEQSQNSSASYLTDVQFTSNNIPSFPTQHPTTSNHPSAFSSEYPSSTPSKTLSESPSLIPSSFPTLSPTASPSMIPTTIPSFIPSFYPTFTKPTSYWNYNPFSDFGPESWTNVPSDIADQSYIEILGKNANKNKCADGKQQSPIILPDLNIHDDNDKKEGIGDCSDEDQIFHQRGDLDWNDLEFQVLPHVLRVKFNQEKGSPNTELSELSTNIPALFMDVKISSEHEVLRRATNPNPNPDYLVQKYHGEVQIPHISDKNKIYMLAFFISAEFDLHNEYFEEFLQRWEDITLEREHECHYRRQSNLDISETPPYQSKHENKTNEEMKQLWGDSSNAEGAADWNLWKLIPSVSYFGYEGSITVAPCTDKVQWRFLDLPMNISFQQFKRLHKVLLNQRDENCLRTSKAYQGSVSRPVQSGNPFQTVSNEKDKVNDEATNQVQVDDSVNEFQNSLAKQYGIFRCKATDWETGDAE